MYYKDDFLYLKGGRYRKKRQRRMKSRSTRRRLRGCRFGSSFEKGIKLAAKEGPKYIRKFSNSSARRVAKDLVRNKIGEKNYKRLEKGINIADKVLS